MSRDLTDPNNEGYRWAHAAVDELLRRIDLHRMTGECNLTIVSNEGGVRAVRLGSDNENFKKP